MHNKKNGVQPLLSSLLIRSFTEIADKVHRGLRVFYKVFTEQAEVLYLHVLRLYAIGDDISNFHRHAKIANITGGTTTAVGGVAAIAGLALAPVTLGASLIVSAVGLGVATAGGITAASATISDNLHDMNVGFMLLLKFFIFIKILGKDFKLFTVFVHASDHIVHLNLMFSIVTSKMDFPLAYKSFDFFFIKQ